MSTTGEAPSPPASISPPTGTKRKRGQEQKFYAVRIGQTPGIYHSWADCLAQVRGVKNATFKSFTSLTDAESFVVNGLSAKKFTSSAPQKYYGVRVGRLPGVYTSWPAAQEQILGWTKPKFRSFSTRTDAEAFVASSGNAAVDGEEILDRDGIPDAAGKKQGPALKKSRKSTTAADVYNSPDEIDLDVEAGEGPLPPNAIDGMDTRLLLNAKTGRIDYKTSVQASSTKMHAIGPSSPNNDLRIYTDGAARGNGTVASIAGIGVYFGPSDPRNVSEPLAGPRQTNQRAELTAIQRALDMAPRDRAVTIYSDSSYAIKCVTEWFVSWRRNGWVTAARKPVENRDLVEAVIARIEEREGLGSRTRFQWLKGHDGDPGNVAADELAVRGAEEARGLRK